MKSLLRLLFFFSPQPIHVTYFRKLKVGLPKYTEVTKATNNTGVLFKSLARPTAQYIFFDGENISLDANLVIYTG